MDDPSAPRSRVTAALQLEAALAGLDDHVAVYDPEWRYVYVNRRAAEVLGRSEQELLGRCIWDLFPDAVGNQYYREVHQAAAERRAIHSEHYYAPFDTWFVNHIYPFDGGVCVISSDITERKRAEAERERLMAQLEAVARQMPAGVLIADMDGGVLFANEQAAAITGLDLSLQEQVVDAPPLAGFTPDGRPLAPEDWPLSRALLRGETVHNEQVHLRRPDRPEIVLEANAAPVRDAQGRMTAAVVVFQDITERRRAEDALREADRRKDEFLAMLSHELRNPLAPIRNAVEVMRIPAASAAQKERAQRVIERQVGHLSRLVDDLLDISRITRGKVELRQETLDLAAAVSRAVESARPLIDSRGQRLSLALPREPILLEGDLVRLSQVIGNLLNNAAKFTPEGGRIDISAERRDGQAVVRVRDDGAGIAAENLEKIFELFVQADRSIARSEGGLGIGLTLVRSLVEMHGGTVEARSEGPGRGSEMVVSLPLRGCNAVDPGPRRARSPR